jgi:hypothetical protein
MEPMKMISRAKPLINRARKIPGGTARRKKFTLPGSGGGIAG